MSRQHQIRLISSLTLPLSLLLSACGGGGGSGVASIPPPPPAPTPTPTPAPLTPDKVVLTSVSGYSITGSLDTRIDWLDSPATRNGNYDVIGRLTLTPGNGGPSSSRTVGSGEFTAVTWGAGDGDDPQYALIAPQGVLPGGLTRITGGFIVSSWTINPTAAYQYNYLFGSTVVQPLGTRLTANDEASNGAQTKLFSYDFNRGSSVFEQPIDASTTLRSTLVYDIGYSYVAMGEWSWRAVDLSGKTVGDSGDLLFVGGDRTPATAIPASGKATYDAHSLLLLGSNGSPGVPFTLTADFGQRTISTQIDQDYKSNLPIDDPTLGIHVSGSAPFSNDGSFDIPLTGTVNYSYENELVPPPSQPVTGDMNGAFFGPNAEQVGGTFALDRSDGTLLMQDAFVGQQQPH